MRLLRPSCLLALALVATPALNVAFAQRTIPRPPPRTPATTSTKDTAKAVIKPQLAAAVTTAYLQGVAVDSLHGEPLGHAIIHVEGTTRMAVTDSLGRFLVDSVPPGSHRLLVDHPLIDTLGISLVTPAMNFVANEVTRTVVSVPTGEFLVNLFCPAAKRALGPGALVGRVREPDSDVAAEGARVSLVWYDPDIPGLPANLRAKKPPRVREAVVGADGVYRLCGLPENFEGKLQAQRKDGGATAEVTVSQSEAVLSLRSMSVAPLPKAIAAGDTGKAAPAPRGAARVLGKVVNANGAPVAGARVQLMGMSNAALTKANGDFVLDSLPAGTQAIVVRQLGYKPTEVPVELSSMAPARVTVRLGVFVPELSPVEVQSVRETGLQKVGFTTRKRSAAGGTFLDTDQIEKRRAMLFSDLLRTVPGIRVSNQSGQGATISSTRGTTGDGCVNVYVDGAPWQSLEAGDLDSFVRPEEVAAVEVYNGSATPAEFVTPGTSCAAVVVWTKTRVQSRGKR